MHRRVPAEWEPQARVWLAWPHNLETWPGRFSGIPEFFSRWTRTISESLPVGILAAADLALQCEQLVGGLADVEIVPIATNDCWIRDYGPTFVENGPNRQLISINWQFNAWGGKYPPWDLDNEVGPTLARHLGLPSVDGQLCLEGGAMEFDGGGRLLTTPDCFLSASRNPGITTEDVAQELHRQLGVTEIVWLDGGGLQGDDTDGHIDQLARFIDSNNVVAAVCDDQSDKNWAGLEDNFRQLRLWGESTSPRVEVHRLPIPAARFIDGTRVPESYCNFLRLGKERMLVPTFGSSQDDRALGLLRELSGAEVIGLNCSELVWGLGALHCGSRDQPLAGEATPPT